VPMPPSTSNLTNSPTPLPFPVACCGPYPQP
jgi:hypothetical protein